MGKEIETEELSKLSVHIPRLHAGLGEAKAEEGKLVTLSPSPREPLIAKATTYPFGNLVHRH